MKLEVTVLIETTKKKAAEVLRLEKNRYKRRPTISVVEDGKYERWATADEAIENELDAYMEVIERAVSARYGTVTAMSAHWVEKRTSADLAQEKTDGL